MENPNPIRTVAPTTDIFENKDEYLVVADVPGVANDAINVEFERGELRLVATRHADDKGEALGRSSGPVEYRRTFRVPDEVDNDGISAKLEGGVLHIKLPKAAELRARKVAVNVA